MDGKWNKPLAVLLFLLMLPKIVWNKLFPPPKSPIQNHYDNMPYVAEHKAEVRKAWESKQRGRP